MRVRRSAWAVSLPRSLPARSICITMGHKNTAPQHSANKTHRQCRNIWIVDRSGQNKTRFWPHSQPLCSRTLIFIEPTRDSFPNSLFLYFPGERRINWNTPCDLCAQAREKKLYRSCWHEQFHTSYNPFPTHHERTTTQVTGARGAQPVIALVTLFPR